MNAGKTVRELPPGTPVPANEAQARALTKVPPEDRAAVMEEASEATGGKPTASAVKAAAIKREAKSLSAPAPGQTARPPSQQASQRPPSQRRGRTTGGTTGGRSSVGTWTARPRICSPRSIA